MAVLAAQREEAPLLMLVLYVIKMAHVVFLSYWARHAMHALEICTLTRLSKRHKTSLLSKVFPPKSGLPFHVKRKLVT